jgi:hypothetical protein
MSEPEFPGRPAGDPRPPPSSQSPLPPATPGPWTPAAPTPAAPIPSAPIPAAPGATGDAFAAIRTPPRRRAASVLVAAVVAVALLGGTATYFLLRSEPGTSGTQTPLALSFDRGDETTYDIHISMEGWVDLGALGEQPLDVDMRESVGWKVLRVDDAGVATVQVSVDEMSGTANGQPMPPTAAGQSMTLRVTRDGQILDANGLSFGSTGSTGLGGFPGMDQVTPILPDHEVAPGDEWDKHFSQSLPFGDGKIEYTAHSTFDRYETLDGVRTAVVTTSYTVPLDFSIDLGDLAKAFGGGGGQLSGLGGDDATIEYGGSGTFTQTSWLDLAAKATVRTTSNGDFDMTMSFPGLEEQLGTGDFGMSATFSMEMTRR